MLEGENYTLSCEVRFGADLVNGPASPVITMDIDGLLLSVDTSLTAKTSSDPYILTATSLYTAVSGDNSGELKCTVHASSPSSYTYSGTQTLDVRYSPAIPTFEPQDDSYALGEFIECVTSANPLPTFTWESVESPAGSGISIPDSLLLITEDMMSDDPYNNSTNVWICTVSNRLTPSMNETYAENDISFTVHLGAAPRSYNPRWLLYLVLVHFFKYSI